MVFVEEKRKAKTVVEEMKLAELKYPINQEFWAEKYSKYIEQMWVGFALLNKEFSKLKIPSFACKMESRIA